MTSKKISGPPKACTANDASDAKNTAGAHVYIHAENDATADTSLDGFKIDGLVETGDT